MSSYFEAAKLKLELPDLVEDFLKQSGLDIIRKHDYTLPDTEAKIEASRGFRLELAVAMAPVLIRLGKAKTTEEADVRLQQDVKILNKYSAEGWYSTMPIVTVVAQRA